MYYDFGSLNRNLIFDNKLFNQNQKRKNLKILDLARYLKDYAFYRHEHYYKSGRLMVQEKSVGAFDRICCRYCSMKNADKFQISIKNPKC